jgi:flagellar basal-body rod modification protein FlgD
MATSNVTNTSTSSYYQSLLDSVNTRKTTTASTASTTEDRFLKLLTTQLKNQDPLNPLDNAQMTSQLAQISTVSGIEKLNTTLQTLLAGSQDSQTTQAAGLVGHSVMVPGSALVLSSTTSASGTTTSAAVGAFELAGAADKVTVTIKDSNGLTVRTLSLGSLGAGLHDFAWDGKSDSGTAAVDGNYTISVAAGNGSDKVTATPLSLGSVRSVLSNGSGFTLDIGSLGNFVLDDVKQVF